MLVQMMVQANFDSLHFKWITNLGFYEKCPSEVYYIKHNARVDLRPFSRNFPSVYSNIFFSKFTSSIKFYV